MDDKMIKEQEKGQEESNKLMELFKNDVEEKRKTLEDYRKIFDEDIRLGDKLMKEVQVQTETTLSRLKEGPTIRDNVKELYEVVGRLIDVINKLGEAFIRLHDRQNELAAKLWRLDK